MATAAQIDPKLMEAFQNSLKSYQVPPAQYNWPLTQYLRERQLYLGTNCETLWDKTRNIQRHMTALDDMYQQQRKALTDEGKREGWIMVLTITRDTCIAFLDLAGALIPSGKVAAGYGSASIQLAQTGSEIFNGQGNAGVQAARTVGNVAGIAKTAGKLGPLADFKLKQGINLSKGVAGMNASTSSAQKHTEASKMAVSTMADMVKGVADMAAPKDAKMTHPAKMAGSIASIIKTVYSYDKATEKAFDDYFTNKIRNEQALAEIDRAHHYRMQRWSGLFKQAQVALNQCRIDNNLS